MIQYKWVAHGLHEIAQEKSKWLEKRAITDPYGNVINYSFRLWCTESGEFNNTLNLTYKEKIFMQINICYDDVDTDEKLTTIINNVFDTQEYQLAFGLFKPSVYKNSVTVLSRNLYKEIAEIIPVNSSGNVLSVDSLIKQYTKELADFLN